MAKHHVKARYGTIPNDLLNNENISLRAKGLYGYLQSKPENWKFCAERMVKQTKDGLDSIKAGLKELEEHKYLHRFRVLSEKTGRMESMEYVLCDVPTDKSNAYPQVDSPLMVKPLVAEPSEVKPLPFSNKEESNTEKSKKEISIDFDFFWNLYDKKEGEKDCRKEWQELTLEDQTLIIKDIPAYIENLVDRKYQKTPLKYLRGEHWKDDRGSTQAKLYPTNTHVRKSLNEKYQ